MLIIFCFVKITRSLENTLNYCCIVFNRTAVLPYEKAYNLWRHVFQHCSSNTLQFLDTLVWVFKVVKEPLETWQVWQSRKKIHRNWEQGRLERSRWDGKRKEEALERKIIWPRSRVRPMNFCFLVFYNRAVALATSLPISKAWFLP